MIIRKNKIVLATRYEMFNVYLKRELYDVYDFNTFLKYCKLNGTRIEESFLDKVKFYLKKILIW